MERKIGEIFEYNGEWLQCVEQPKKYDKTVCALCAFQGNGNCELDRCSGTYRSDKKFVIFKKLEKVGEPYEYFIQGLGIIILLQEYILANPSYTCDDNKHVFVLDFQNGRVAIEIKQTKEDMEEKKQKRGVSSDTINEINKGIEPMNTSRNIDTEHSSSEKIGKNLKPFDLEAAKAGKPVCTRDGRKARIICFDRVGDFPIVALTDDRDYKEEGVNLYDINGKGSNECFDLMMLPEKKEGWVNVYKDSVYGTKDEALIVRSESRGYIDTIKINWSE